MNIPFEESKLSQLATIGICWAIEDTYADAALARLQNLSIAGVARMASEARAEEDRLTVESKAKSGQQSVKDKPYLVVGKTAVLNVSGPMTKRPTSASMLFGGTSTLAMSRMLRTAKSDTDIEKILMIFETPGGEAAGCAEFADVIREVNQAKPITAYISDMCASAGYFAASQCSQILMNRMGFTGCIGTLSVLTDSSAQASMVGLKVIKITSDGAETYKGMGVPGLEITDETKAYYKSIVNHYGNDFKATVQMGRGLTDEQVKAVAIGKLLTADEALSMGLIDGVCSFEECVNQLSATVADDSTTAGKKPAKDPAKASSAATRKEEPPMKLKEFFASLGKVPALADSGIDFDNVELPTQEATFDPAQLNAMKSEMERMQNAALHNCAIAFYNSLNTPDENGAVRASWSQREGIISTFVALAKLDGVKFSDQGSLVPGTNLAAYVKSMETAPASYLQTSQIKGDRPISANGVRPEVIARNAKRLESDGRAPKGFADAVVAAVEGN